MAARKHHEPLPVQERLRDMQSLLILKNIRADHDEDPTVLGALDHAIGIIQKRVDKSTDNAAADFRLNFLRDIVPIIERGAAQITNFGVERDIESIQVASLDDPMARSIPGRARFTYSLSIESSESIVR